MKDANPTAARRAPEPEEFTSRKLIRPALSRPESRSEQARADQIGAGRERALLAPLQARRANVPEQTHAESFYFQKQMQTRTPMVLVLKTGEQIEGVIEWYDRNCVKIQRPGEPNLLIYKPSIRYLYKQSERR